MKTKKFIKKLRKTAEFFGEDWKIHDDDEFIRIFTKPSVDECYCPITAVCLMQTGKKYRPWDAPEAGKLIGLKNRQIRAIMEASDHHESAYGKLRARLLKAMLNGQNQTKNQKAPPA